MDSNARPPTAYSVALGLTIAFSVLAVVVMLPNPAASKPNVLGYRSVCSYAPASSALCGLLAGLTCTVRNRRFSRNAASARYRPLILPVGIGVPLVVIAVVFGVRFGAVQSRFETVIAKTGREPALITSLPDGTRSATFSEGDVSATVELIARGGRISALRLKAGKNVDETLAKQIFDKVMTAGSVNVDAVSGATASWTIDAVKR